jgi:DNA-binding MarR family transcriptional regulator
MPEKRTTDEPGLVPMLDYLARVGRRAAEALPDTLRPRHVIALELLSKQGPLGQQRLADALRLDPSNMVGLLNELEARGLVSRRRDPTDRRRHLVELSDQGAQELATASTRFGLIEDELFSSLNAEERRTLQALVSRAVGATSQQCLVAPVARDADRPTAP